MSITRNMLASCGLGKLMIMTRKSLIITSCSDANTIKIFELTVTTKLESITCK